MRKRGRSGVRAGAVGDLSLSIFGLFTGGDLTVAAAGKQRVREDPNEVATWRPKATAQDYWTVKVNQCRGDLT